MCVTKHGDQNNCIDTYDYFQNQKVYVMPVPVSGLSFMYKTFIRSWSIVVYGAANTPRAKAKKFFIAAEKKCTI